MKIRHQFKLQLLCISTFCIFIKWNDNRCIKKLAFVPFCMYVSVLLICLQPNQENKNISRKCNFVIECIYIFFALRCHQPILSIHVLLSLLHFHFKQIGCFTYLLIHLYASFIVMQLQLNSLHE